MKGAVEPPAHHPARLITVEMYSGQLFVCLLALVVKFATSCSLRSELFLVINREHYSVDISPS